MGKALIVIPAFNEARVIGRVVKSVRNVVPEMDVVVVDDGSADGTGNKAKLAGARVVRHAINRGLGGAIGTGLLYAKRNDYKRAVTIDADGQHDPKDILKMLKVLQNDEADVVVGSRMISRAGHMPLDRKVINTVANILTWIMFGMKTTDSQSGFRGFSRRAIEELRLRTDRMEVSSEVFAEIRRLGLRYAEVPIKVRYTKYSLAKGQVNANSINIGLKLMLRLFR